MTDNLVQKLRKTISEINKHYQPSYELMKMMILNTCTEIFIRCKVSQRRLFVEILIGMIRTE